MGVYSHATGNVDGTENDAESVIDNLEQDVPHTIGITVDTTNEEGTLAGTLQMLLVITVISLAPSIVVMMTSFTRIIVVFHFLRTALGTQSTPPNNVLIGLALFLTLFIMSPTLERINEEGIQPLSRGEITQEEGLEACMEPLRDFMFANVETQDINFFLELARLETVSEIDDIPNSVLIPAFMLGELRKSFIIGFLIYIPFIIIDMVVASTLMAMGMMMLPPTTISMPFKILLFVMANGWNLVIGELIKSFNY
ncbi:MAG: flagellar type III secretion system pore protein FliP [Lachnospiraceae bacterium]|nr:flagellar type III secretion system pore protein FliP [Lachnospiraceae bacterium]